MKNKNKILLLIILIAFLFTTIYLVGDAIEFNTKVKIGKNKIRVTYVITDYDKTKNVNFNDFSAYRDSIITSYSMSEIAKKEGKYYVSTIQNMNENVFKNIKKITFGINNVSGEVISDAKYDKKTKKIYIPTKYFEDKKYKSYDGCPIRMEMVSQLKSSTLNKNNIDVKVTKIFSESKVLKTKSYSENPQISLYNYNKGTHISQNDFKVYINNMNVPLLPKNYSYNSKTGVITFKFLPFYLNKIEVKFKKVSVLKNSLLNSLLIGNALAVSDDNPTVGKASYNDGGGGQSIYKSFNGFVSSFSAPYCYKGSSGYICTEGYSNKASDYFDDSILASPALETSSGSYKDFVIYISSFTIVGNEYEYSCPTDDEPSKTCKAKPKLTITVNEWLRLYCEHVQQGQNNNPTSNMGFNMTIGVDSSTGEITIVSKSTSTAGNQYAEGQFDLRANMYTLKVQKKVYNNSNGTFEVWKKKGIRFRVYSGFKSATDHSDCNGKVIASKKTDANGVATFKNLPKNATYCVKEIFSEADDSSSISGNNYYKFANCNLSSGANKVLEAKVNSTSFTGNSYCNVPKLYCIRIAKNDQPTNCLVNGITFRLDGNTSLDGVTGGGVVHASPGSSGTATSEGYVIYDMLGYSSANHTIQEVSFDGTKATLASNCGSSPFFYWNTNKSLSYQGAATQMSFSNGTYTCPTNATTLSDTDNRVYYCARVKKVDKDTGQVLGGATFTAYRDQNLTSAIGSSVSAGNGIAEFYYGNDNNGGATYNTGSYWIKETKAPKGYAPDPNPKNVGVTVMDPSTNSGSWNNSSLCGANAETFVYQNTALKITWYKVVEDSKSLFKTNDESKVPTFEVYDSSGKKLYHTATKVRTSDSSGSNSRMCYQVTDSTVDSGADVFKLDSDGQVCIRGVENGQYTIVEKTPGQYHTFGSTDRKTVSASADFLAMDDTNKFVNYPTRFEFGKNIVSSYSSTDEGSYKDLTTSELRKLKFNVTDVSGQIVRFKKKKDANNNVIEGEYEYLNNTIDPQGEEEVTDLQLNSDRKFIIWHLPWADSKSTNGAKYKIKEKREDGCTDQNQNTCNGNGFYYPEYNNDSDTEFIIYQTSSPQSINKTEPKQSLSNTPTEIKFTKDDIYCKDSNCNSNYQNGTNGTTQDSVFENEEEIKVFDDIQFVLRDSTGRDVTDHLIKVSDNEYRFVKDVNTLSDELKAKLVKTDSSVVGNNLHTKDGTLKITHLCRESTYYIEEYKVPEHTVFILPTTIKFDGTVPANWNWQGHPYVTYKVSDKESTKKTSPYSDTQVIDNTPTRVIIYKKDSKYDYLIPDETTTFQLYRCKKGEGCHPTDDPDNTENYERVRFWNRALIPGDKEDSNNDKTGLQTEVYKFVSTSDEKSMSESDLKSKTTYDLHPDHGVLVFRYLPANYNYVLVETVAPKNYQLPVGRNAETSFKVVDNTVEVDDKDLPNKPTSILIKKYSEDGLLLKGTQFKIYKAKGGTCNNNLSAANQDMELLKLKTIRDGVYEARPEEDTDTIVTCSDRDDAKCNDIKTHVSKELTTKLTHDKYEDSWTNFDDESTSTEDGRKIELQEGEALIQYLEYDNCYIIEETKAPEGYSLPKNKEDRYTMITIKKNDEFAHDTGKTLINKPTPFKFYKYDEFNKLIDGAEFKLQKLDNNKKYQDVTVSEKEENGELFYKVDKDTDNTLIRTKGGTATIYYLTAGQYRILETKAPDGKELPKNPNISTFFVDENGSVYGNPIITNKSITKKIEVKNSASAELVVSIQTGQTIIRYGLVIAVLVGMISGLMILREKKSRKDYNKDEK